MMDATKGKFERCHKNIEMLIGLDSTKPQRKQLLQSCKDEDLVELKTTVDSFDQKFLKIQEKYVIQENTVHDYDELLNQIDLRECCKLMEANGQLNVQMKDFRHEIDQTDSNIDLLTIKIGELDVAQACLDYEQQKDDMYHNFEQISTKGKLLLNYCHDYEEFVEDKDAKVVLMETKSGIEGFLRTVSTKQAEQVDKKIKQL